MPEQEQTTLFRKKALEKVSTPDQLSQYLHVTNPGVWVILVAVLLLIAGMFAWASIGSLETTAEVKIVVEDEDALVIPVNANGSALEVGMTLRVDAQDKEYELYWVDYDDYDRKVAYAYVDLPDGTYDAEVVTGSVKPIKFLTESR